MTYSEQFSIGDCVVLTPAGAKAHRAHHTANAVVGGAAALAAAAPIAIGAGIGIAAAGTAVGVSTGVAGAAAGSAAGATASVFGNFPEGGMQGRVVDIQRRWWGQSGYDYEILWQNNTRSWHLGMHLNRV